MIRSRAHYFTKCFYEKLGKRYDDLYADLEAQGFLIYCISLEDFDKNRASFSTYLYRNLSGRLSDYCKAKEENESLDIGFVDLLKTDAFDGGICFDIFSAKKCNPTLDELLRYAKDCLSSDAYKVFSWILKRQWENKGCKTPSVTQAKWLFCGVSKWSIERVHRAWAEIGDFWHSGLLEQVL